MSNKREILEQAQNEIVIKKIEHGFFRAANEEEAKKLVDMCVLKPGTIQNKFNDLRYEIMTLLAENKSYTGSYIQTIIENTERNYSKDSPERKTIREAMRAVVESILIINKIEIAEALGFTKSQASEVLGMYNDIVNGIDEPNSLILRIENYLQKIEQIGQNKAQNSILKPLFHNTAHITDKEYRFALSPLPNPHAYIQQLDAEFFQQLEFDEQNGTMRLKDDFLEEVTLQNAVTRSNIKELDMSLLRSLYTIIYRYASKIDTNTVTVDMPTLANHLGINVRNVADKSKANDLMKKIRAFDNVIGVLENGSFWRLLVFMGYNKNDNTITFGSPYMNRVLKILQEKNTVTKTKKNKKYINPHYSFLVHGNIANERNKAAVEIVHVIITLLLQRGEEKPKEEKLTKKEIQKAAYDGARQATRDEFGDKTDDINTTDKEKDKPHKTKVNKSFIGIIEAIPLLKESLNNHTIDKKTGKLKEKTAREKNTTLKNAFSKAYELLKKKTDAYKYFKNLNIPLIVPTVSTLDNTLVITHEGLNKSFDENL